MAPPSPRRPGFSRRAQYGIFVSYVIAIAGVILALLLVVTARFDPAGHSALQSVATDLTSPVSGLGRAAVQRLSEAGESVTAYFQAASKNKAMAEELSRSRRKLIEADVLKVENARLRQLLGVRETSVKHIASAPLVSSSGTSSRRYAILAAGAVNGVANGQPVLGPDGLVGRTVAVGQTSARVLLIIDAGNVTPVKRARDGSPALAIGTGDGRLVLRPLTGAAAGSNAADATPFRRGDIFVTSGAGGTYRPGIPVAQAIDQGREGALARPLADPSRLDFALVEPVYLAKPPPVPSALPSQEGE